MQKILDRYKTGITISQVTMQNAQPPEQVQAAFDDAVKANQDEKDKLMKVKHIIMMLFLKQRERLLVWCNKLRVTVKE